MDVLYLKLFCTLLMISISKSEISQGKDYCQFDMFNASCSDGEVILITSANYGRMKTGRCMPGEYGVGCFTDVIVYLDTLCSGRKSCSFEVPGKLLKGSMPCEKGLTPYLEASYQCVKVTKTENEKCFHSNKIHVDVPNKGYLASVTTRETRLGSSSCPWVLRARPGQRINATVWDFSGPYSRLSDNSRSSENEVLKSSFSLGCYATMRDPSTNKERAICSSERRHTQGLVSQSNLLEIAVMSSGSTLAPYFMIEYEVIGCEHLQPPAHGWIQITNGRAVFGCNDTQEKWHMVCNQYTWIGHLKNCTQPHGILLVTVLGIALGLVLGISLLSVAVFCIRRRKSRCFYGDHSYEEAKLTHCDAHGVYYGPQTRSPNTRLVEQIEMSQQNETPRVTTGQPQHYGTMSILSFKPPAYSSNPSPIPAALNDSAKSVRKAEIRKDRLNSSNDMCDARDYHSQT